MVSKVQTTVYYEGIQWPSLYLCTALSPTYVFLIPNHLSLVRGKKHNTKEALLITCLNHFLFTILFSGLLRHNNSYLLTIKQIFIIFIKQYDLEKECMWVYSWFFKFIGFYNILISTNSWNNILKFYACTNASLVFMLILTIKKNPTYQTHYSLFRCCLGLPLVLGYSRRV